MSWIASVWIAALASALVGRGSVRASGEDVLVVHVAGLRGALVDPKDQALGAALDMLGARLAELPDELGDAAPPPQVFPLLARLAHGSFDLRAGIDESPDAAFPFYAQLALHAGSPREAAALGAEVEGALAAVGAEVPPPDERGLRPIPAPLPAWFGPLGGDFVVALGRTVEEPLELGPLHLPEGVRPSLALRLDLGRLLGVAADFGGGQPEVAQLLELVDRFGLSDARFSWAAGCDAERSYAVTSVAGVAASMRASGLLPEQPLSPRSIAVVPEDALWARVGANDLGAMLEVVRGFAREAMPSEQDPLDALAEVTGFHLEHDFLDYVGRSVGVYASDTTGGGGLASIVAFAELGDQDGLVHALDSVKRRWNELGRSGASGYVAVREREVGGFAVSTLLFPGLPIPFEPSYVVANGFLFAGLTPQAVAAAARHAGSDSRGLAGRAALLEQLPEGFDGLSRLSFLDTQRLLREGYGWASLATSALSNAVRSRSDAARDPGSILPSYPELAAGAKAWVSTTRLVGDDLVELTRMDRSLVVNATALVGFMSSLSLLMTAPGLIAGVVSGAEDVRFDESGGASEEEWVVFEAVEPEPEAVAAQLESDLLALHYAAVEYALFNDGAYPDDLQVLVIHDENGVAYLEGGMRLDPWGREYAYEQAQVEGEAPRIYTLGRDGTPGGEGLDADVDNADLLQRRKEGGR